MRAEKFSGYEGLKLVDLPKTVVSDGKVLLRMTAAGVTPLEHTILSGHFPLAKAPLVLGSEGAGVVEAGGGKDFPVGSRVGNAVTQLARALGAKHAISSTTNHAKAEQARTLGFGEVIDTSAEKLGDGVRRITGGYGADIVIDGIGGEILSEALGALAPGGSLTTLGLFGRSQDNHRCHQSNLATGKHQELHPVHSTTGGLGGRLEHYRLFASIRSDQTDRGQDVPAG
jgi:NADPH:quinone reductase-like Zn-dependent oxidoreductase